MEAKEATAIKKEPPVAPKLVIVKMETNPIEPEFVTVKQEAPWCVAMEAKEDTAIKKKPRIAPKLVIVKMETNPIEPEFVTIKQEAPWCGSVNTDIDIKKEPTTKEMVAMKMEPFTEPELAATQQEPCNKQGFSSNVLHTASYQDMYKSYSINHPILSKPYVCNICEDRFHLKKQLFEHKRIHNSKYHCICDYCKKLFFSKSQIIRHLVVHSSERPYRCKTCSKTFRLGISLKGHEQIHLEKTHGCHICKKYFARACYLTVHLRTHTKEKRYSCDVCKRSFAKAISLKRHNSRGRCNY